MTAYSYDLHIHSCLSPCGDDDMTPANIAGMAALKGLQLIALTDHNSCKNCPAFFKACKQYGIVPVPGMELTTAEEIHLVCLFPTLEAALEFDEIVYPRILPIKNRPEIFGRQQIMDHEDNVLREEPVLLISATDLTLEEAYGLVTEMGGAAYPAHIDRESNGIIAILGAMPEEPRFPTVELNDGKNAPEYIAEHALEGKLILCSSDAHNLWSINEAEHILEIDDEPYSSALVRQRLIEMMRGAER